MKRRTTILNTLKSNVSTDLHPVVLELFEEIKDFYNKLDLYYHYHKNLYLFKAIYIEGKKNLQISHDLPLDSKQVTKFVKETEDFTRDLIITYKKYSLLISYIHKK